MIGLVLLSQGQLATSFHELLKDLPHTATCVRSVCIIGEDDLELKRHELMRAIDAVNQGNGVLILTEVFCGMSTNLALSILDLKPIEVIAGMNLAMMLRILQLPDDTLLQEAAEIAKETGRKHISIASQFLDTYYQEQISKPAA